MAKRCGLTTHTLRYYERIGLIQPVGRASNGHRRYSLTDEAWIEFLHCMRMTDMPIRELQRYAKLRERGDDTTLERRQILEDHLAAITAQVAQLQQAQKVLGYKIANGKKIEQRIQMGQPLHGICGSCTTQQPESGTAQAD